MLVFTQKPEEQYFEVIDNKGPTIFLFGETSEHWTSKAIEFLERNNTSIYFFPWSKIQNLRLQLGLIKYPFMQLWRDGKCIFETTGYHEELLEELVNKFFTSKK